MILERPDYISVADGRSLGRPKARGHAGRGPAGGDHCSSSVFLRLSLIVRSRANRRDCPGAGSVVALAARRAWQVSQ